jgi:hypothetical protein
LPFQLHISAADKAYLDNLPLSPQAKARVKDFIDYGLVYIAADFRTDPANRPDPSKPFFVRDFLLVDFWGDDRWHRIEFTVDDSKSSDGKLVVVYVDHTDGEWSWSDG